MKKRSGLIVICLLMLCFTYMTDISAQGKTNTEIKVGYFDYSGFIEENEDGEFYGYGVEYLSEVSKYTGWEYEYVYGSWSQCLERLKNGEIDLLCTAQYTEERARDYDYCDYSSGLEYTVLYADSENTELYYEDYEHLNGTKAGLMKNSYQNELYYEFEEERSLNMEEVYFDTNQAMEDALKEGTVDIIVSGSLDASPEFKLISKIGITPFYFITDKGDENLLSRLNLAMKELQIDRPFFNSYLYEKYYGKPVNSMVGQTREEAEYIQETKLLRVAYAKNSFPMEYTDNKTGEAAGLYPEILKKISQYAQIEFEFVQAANPSEAIRMVNQGDADLVSAVYGNTAVREAYGISYTQPYLTSDISVIARRGSAVEAVEDLTVAIPSGYTSYVIYLQEKYPAWEIKSYSRIDECKEAADRGDADIALADALYLQAYSEPTGWKDLSVVSGMEISMPISIGMKREQPEVLASVLNKAILKVTDADIKEARVKNTTENNLQLDVKTWLKRNIPFLIGAIALWGLCTLYMLHRKEVYYRRLAMIDDLTGVWNRNKFIKEAEKLLNHNRNKEYCLISTDVDKFKNINDTFGYSTGDDVLREQAVQFAKIFEEKGIYARVVADEFVGLVECSSEEEKKILTGKLYEFENRMRSYSNQYFRIQIKIGICCIEKRAEEARITECIDKANIAKKRIKGNLNQSIAYFDNETARRSALENEIEGKMEKALENKEFCVYYQPKYNLRTQEIEGAEALVRWIDPEKGMIGPDSFIPLFEKNGFIIRLDFYVYEEVCRHLKQWRDEGKRIVPVSVNVSRAHVSTDSFIPDLAALLRKYEIPVELIELELTESLFSEDSQVVKRMVNMLKNMGFHISIDDFGSGYSSLNLLKQIPADVLKIDRAFLEEIEDSVKSKIIIAQVVQMARKINIHTVCEGVETKKQADFLRDIHCDVAQGYLFSKPVPMKEFEAKIAGQS